MSVNVDGFGSVTWWGFSPALNLISLYEQGRRFEVEIIIVYLNYFVQEGRRRVKRSVKFNQVRVRCHF